MTTSTYKDMGESHRSYAEQKNALYKKSTDPLHEVLQGANLFRTMVVQG